MKDDVTKLLHRLVSTHGDSAVVVEVTALVTSLVNTNAALRARVEKLEKGLKDIIRHYELMGGKAAQFSSVVNIAVNALAACEEVGNGRFADMLESSVVDWRKLYAEERAERVRIQHILMDDVQSERQESDEHIKGLNTIIATQDKNIGDLKAHIQRIEVDHDDVEARAEAAEARVRELEQDERNARRHSLDLEKVERELTASLAAAEARVRELVAEAAKRQLASDDEQTIADLEAFKARVMEWARGNCGCCEWTNSPEGHCPRCKHLGLKFVAADQDNWTPPQAWEVGE